MSNSITLQINFSAGDILYFEESLLNLRRGHHQILYCLVILDCIKRTKSKRFDPDSRYPNQEFQDRIGKMKLVLEKYRSDGLIDKIYYLEERDPLIDEICKKYNDGFERATHSWCGVGIMSYYAGIELAETKYVLHYDGDMILYQQRDFDWAIACTKIMESDSRFVFAVPRLCPPLEDNLELPSLQEGRPFENFEEYWTNDWFSARQYLVDKEKLLNHLPLFSLRVKAELLARQILRRAHPLDVEVILFKALHYKTRTVKLKSDKAWLLHPLTKPVEYIKILGRIVERVEIGERPPEQAGNENIDLISWQNFLQQ